MVRFKADVNNSFSGYHERLLLESRNVAEKHDIDIDATVHTHGKANDAFLCSLRRRSSKSGLST